ncbi:unnamed protein product [Rhodiola kirilowii]
MLRNVANAGIVVSDRISRDVSLRLDLEEALEASRYTSNPFSTHPREWLPFVDVLTDRYNASGGEGTALCGIFQEILMASVNNFLFLWCFDKWDGHCPEYSGEEQTICAVGLAKAKPGIFIKPIQYLVLLATLAELVLLGVRCSARSD